MDAAARQVEHLQELIKIGLALSREKHLHHLLEMIVSEARRFTGADGGTLYIRRETSPVLDFAILQNDTLGVRMGGGGETITWEPVPLYLPSGGENHHNVSAYSTLTGETVNIDDVYFADGFDFTGTKGFDNRTGYRSKSMLVIPMRDHEDVVIGVLQLLNARDEVTGEVGGFSGAVTQSVTSLASLAAIAITKIRLIKGLEDLLESFVRSIAMAIDEKSHYTAGHIARVAELTERLVAALNRGDGRGRLAGVSISGDEMEALRLAAWLHDVGKITTPEYVVDKATKLEALCDRIELVHYRVEILKKDVEIRTLRERLAAHGDDDASAEARICEARICEARQELDRHFALLAAVNKGGDYLGDELVEKISKIAGIELVLEGEAGTLLSDDEARNLSLRRGTLNSNERAIINNHVRMTIKMLEGLPYPRKLRHVPLFAGLHHEKMDGSGYPFGVAGEKIPIPARILAVADVFEALTAADRPYKPGRRLSESMRILAAMGREGHLDEAVCDLLVDSGVAGEYAKEMLAETQRDAFEWCGRRYES